MSSSRTTRSTPLLTSSLYFSLSSSRRPLRLFHNCKPAILNFRKDLSGVKAALTTVAKKSPPNYHSSGFMKSLLTEPKTPGESDNYVKYLTQLQEETVVRLHEKLFGPVTGMDLKFWLPFGKKKFMGFSL